MNLKQLTYIVTIAEQQSISKASEQLFISRPALNHFLLDLERELGLPLFKRVQKKLIPTYAGNLYIQAAVDILERKKQIYKALEDISNCNVGCLSLGITRGFGVAAFNEVFPVFHQAYPSYTVHLVEGNVRDLEDAVSRGVVDIAIVGQGSVESKLEHLTFVPCEVVLMLPPGHPLSHMAAPKGRPYAHMDLRLLEKEAFVLMNSDTNIRAIADRHFSLAEYSPKILLECSLSSMAYHMVRNGVGPSILMETQYIPDDDVSCFSLEPREIWRQSLAYRKGTIFTQAEKYFVSLVEDYYNSSFQKGILE